MLRDKWRKWKSWYRFIQNGDIIKFPHHVFFFVLSNGEEGAENKRKYFVWTCMIQIHQVKHSKDVHGLYI